MSNGSKISEYTIQTIAAKYESVFPAEEDEDKDVHDNCTYCYLTTDTPPTGQRTATTATIRNCITSYIEIDILMPINSYIDINETNSALVYAFIIVT